MDPFGQYVANLITARAPELTDGILAHQATVDERRLLDGIDLSQETRLRLAHLAEGLAADRPALFEHHVAWLKVAYASRSIPLRLISDGLRCTVEQLERTLPADAAAHAAEVVARGEETLWDAPESLPSLIDGSGELDELTRRYLLAVLENRSRDAVELVLDAHRSGVDVGDIHEQVLARAQAEVGRMWQMAELNVAEEHVGSRITEKVLILLGSRIEPAATNGKRLVATSVTGNPHEIGLRIVADQFGFAGWEIVMLGADLPVLDLAAAIRDFGGDLVALSSGFLHVRTTAGLIATLRSLEESADVPILVGGPAFNVVGDLWEVVGADGTGRTGPEAVRVGNRLAGL